jgi:glycosyltransferase involved in cell wall biosynthesis
MSSGTPLVSIGMCVYNEERFISQALDSLLSQTFRDFEIIIVDNASQDATERICQDYISRDNRIRYLRNAANIGGAKSGKLALTKSSGRYFMWAGGHDLWHPSYISECLNVLESDPQVVLCYAQVTVIDANGDPQELIEDAIDTRSLDAFNRCRATMWGLSRIPICDPINGLIKSDSLRRTEPARNVWGPDNLILIELSLDGAIAQIRKPLYYRRTVRNPAKDVALWTERYLERINPQNREKRVLLTYSRMCYEYFRIIRRSGFSVPQKLMLFLDALASICHRWWRGMLFHDFICAPIRLFFGRRAVYVFKRCVYGLAKSVNLYR